MNEKELEGSDHQEEEEEEEKHEEFSNRDYINKIV